jgi:hypothetical protein
MQTFMPHDSYEESAQALDTKRLRNQRNECKVILKTLLGEYPVTRTGRPGGWPNHPATKMWKGYEYALCCYALEICIRREQITGDLTEFFESRKAQLPPGGSPLWMGLWTFHESHRSNLVRKDPDYYGPKWPDARPGLEYVWPGEEERS